MASLKGEAQGKLQRPYPKKRTKTCQEEKHSAKLLLIIIITALLTIKSNEFQRYPFHKKRIECSRALKSSAEELPDMDWTRGQGQEANIPSRGQLQKSGANSNHSGSSVGAAEDEYQ
jgi:hypothetical protein